MISAAGLLPPPRGRPYRVDDGADQGLLRGLGQFEHPTDPATCSLRQMRVIENTWHAITLIVSELPENVNVIRLISNGFDDLGVPPVLGREFCDRMQSTGSTTGDESVLQVLAGASR